MAKVIIFGQRDYAEQAHYYLTHDSPHEVVGFSVTGDWMKNETFCGLPVTAFEEVEQKFPPGEFSFFVPMSGRRMNKQREEFFFAAKAKGYSLISYVSSRATLCENEIGENCFILERVNIQPFTRIGDNVVIWCNVHVGHHCHVGDHVSIISGTSVSGRCQIGDYSYIAANSIINDHVILGEGTLVSLGSVVKSHSEPWSVYSGNPARKRRMRSDAIEFL
ncbi:MAG: acetyltransferase [Verrucomicrobiota bacterium]